MAYQPIEHYGIIGDTQTVTLVGANASVDWFCFPRFDSPSVFSAILDDKKGGYFRISSQTDNITYKQLYWPETNVLITSTRLQLRSNHVGAGGGGRFRTDDQLLAPLDLKMLVHGTRAYPVCFSQRSD